MIHRRLQLRSGEELGIWFVDCTFVNVAFTFHNDSEYPVLNDVANAVVEYFGIRSPSTLEPSSTSPSTFALLYTVFCSLHCARSPVFISSSRSKDGVLAPTKRELSSFFRLLSSHLVSTYSSDNALSIALA